MEIDEVVSVVITSIEGFILQDLDCINMCRTKGIAILFNDVYSSNSEYSIFIARALKYIDDTANKVGLNEEDKIKVLERVVERIKDIGKVNGWLERIGAIIPQDICLK